MDDDAPPSVEFLGGVADASGEELLAAPPSNPVRTALALLAGGLLLLAVVGVAIARGGGQKGAAPAAGSHPSSAVVLSGPLPVTGGQGDGNASALADCPTDARCSVWVHAPAATLAALRAAFPRAVVRTANTVLANRSGHFEPDVLRRVLVAQDGSRTIRVGIRAGSEIESASAAGRDRPPTGARTEVRVHRPGYRICVAVSGPGAGEVARHAMRLAADARLLAPL